MWLGAGNQAGETNQISKKYRPGRRMAIVNGSSGPGGVRRVMDLWCLAGGRGHIKTAANEKRSDQ